MRDRDGQVTPGTPSEGGGDLGGRLLDAWPAYLSYFVSFAFIGGSWIAHSSMTRFVKAADPALMRLNLLLLLFVSLLPFLTKLMATRRVALLFLLAATVLGMFLPLAAVVVFLLVSVLLLLESLWRTRVPATPVIG